MVENEFAKTTWVDDKGNYGEKIENIPASEEPYIIIRLSAEIKLLKEKVKKLEEENKKLKEELNKS